jgi:hypothetical protein
VNLAIDFDTDPTRAALSIAGQLGSMYDNTAAWHRAARHLDELKQQTEIASQTESKAAAKASLLRQTAHLARTRACLVDLYALDWSDVAAQIANPPPAEPTVDYADGAAEPSASEPSSEAERQAKAKARANELCEQAAKKVNRDVTGYLERHAGEGDETARHHAALMFALVKNTASDALTNEGLASVQQSVAGMHESMASLSKVVASIIRIIRAREAPS